MKWVNSSLIDMGAKKLFKIILASSLPGFSCTRAGQISSVFDRDPMNTIKRYSRSLQSDSAVVGNEWRFENNESEFVIPVTSHSDFAHRYDFSIVPKLYISELLGGIDGETA